MAGENPLEALIDSRVPAGLGGRWYGAYPALVTDVVDPEGEGRVQVTLPWAPADSSYKAWARLATLMGGGNRGSFIIPDKNDEVLVIFEGGDPRRPYVIGGLWNGKDKPPEGMDRAGKNNLKVLRSRNGVKVTLDDTDGKERVIMETPAGQKLVLSDGPNAVELSDGNGNSLKMESGGITITSRGNVTINGTKLAVSVAQASVDAGVTRITGMLHTDTVKSDTVISTSYTPGAGNMW